MVDILMPALSPTMEEGTLAKWLVKEGDAVASGDIIAEIETDKATMEVESIYDGVVARILVSEGTENVPVNTPIANVAEEGEGEGEEAAPEPTNVNGDGTSPIVADIKKEQNTVPNTPPPPSPVVATPVAIAPDLPEGTEMQNMTVRLALRDAMAEEMRRDGNVFILGEEVAEYEGAYKVTQGLLEEFGKQRVVDTPITEHGFTGLGVGTAFAGLKPIVEFMTFNFAMQAIDQIINSAAKTHYMSGGQMQCPIVFRGPNGAASRVAAQHSQDYAAWYSSVPGLYVVQPYSAADAKGLLKTAIRSQSPVIFLENEILYGHSFDVPVLDDFTIPFGKARLWRTGSDVTIISYGIGMTKALEAAEQLGKEGIDAEVLDLRTLRPVDIAAIVQSVQKTNRCVTVEEGWPVCSYSSYLAALIMTEAFDYLDAPVAMCTGKDVPMPYAANLEKMALVTTDEVVAATKSVLYR